MQCVCMCVCVCVICENSSDWIVNLFIHPIHWKELTHKSNSVVENVKKWFLVSLSHYEFRFETSGKQHGTYTYLLKHFERNHFSGQ